VWAAVISCLANLPIVAVQDGEGSGRKVDFVVNVVREQ